MLCISLKQPWAQLVVLGLKTFETRSWRARYKGRLAIQASKTVEAFSKQLLDHEPFRSALAAHGFDAWEKLPRQAILGTVELVDYCEAEQLLHEHKVSDADRAFGDFRPGRWGWLLRNPRRLPVPIPCRGKLSLFPLSDDIATLVEANI